MSNLSSLLTQLKEPIPDEYYKTKTQGGQEIRYIPWSRITDLLDERLGGENWEWMIKEVKQLSLSEEGYGIRQRKLDLDEANQGKKKLPEVKESLVLVGSLTIHGSDRSISRDATGIESLDCSNYGDPSSNAEAMALRRAAAKFGLDRSSWNKQSFTHQFRGKGEISKEEFMKRKQLQGAK